MEKTIISLLKGYKYDDGLFTYSFGDGYELCFETLLFDEQMYVALYKNGELLTRKVVVKPGKGGLNAKRK